MRTNVMVPCGHCAGEGYVLHGRATEMFRAVCSAPWQSTAALAKQVRIGSTNAANVLALLRELDFVERRGSGSRHSPYEWKVKR